MVDNLSILLSHALLLYMFYHLVQRDDLDDEPPPPKLPEKVDSARFRPVKPKQRTKNGPNAKGSRNA